MKKHRLYASVCLALSCTALLTAANVSVGDDAAVIRLTRGQEPTPVPPAQDAAVPIEPPPSLDNAAAGSSSQADPPAGSSTRTPPTATVPFGAAPPPSAPVPQNGTAGQAVVNDPLSGVVTLDDYSPYFQRSGGVTEAPFIGPRPAPNPPFGPLVNFQTNFDEGLGYDSSYHTANVLLPYHVVPGQTVLLADLSASLTAEGRDLYNFGIVYRNYDALRNRIFGWNGYFDIDNGAGEAEYQRVGFGFESLGKYLDFRANGYVVSGDDSVLLSSELIGDLTLGGNNAFRNRREVRQNAYSGAEFEIGGPLPLLGRRGLNSYVGAYWLNADEGDETVGFSARTEALITESLTAGFTFTNDDTFGSNGSVNISYTFPNYRQRRIFQPRLVRERLGDPVVRNSRIHTNVDTSVTAEALINADKNRPFFFTFVDPNQTELGNGTLENPFNSLQLAANNNNPDVDLIRIAPRADDTNTNLTVDGGFQLFDHQTLLSATENFTLFTEGTQNFVIPGETTATGLGPLVSNPSNNANSEVIRVANKNQIIGLRIDGSNADGSVIGNGIRNDLPFEDTRIVNNTFTNYLNAIELADGSGEIVVEGNTFTGTIGSSQNALSLTTAAGEQVDLLIADNIADNHTESGFTVTTGAGSTLNAANINGFNGVGNPAVQRTGILNNVVTSSQNGIVVDVENDSVAELAIEGNTSANNLWNGLVVRADDSLVNLSTLRNNTFDGNGESGASLTFLNGGRFFAVSEDINEDANLNGVLDPGEDLNGDGLLTVADGILGVGEDLNGNGVLDQGIVSNTFSNNVLAGLHIFGEDNSEGFFDIGGPTAALGNTFASNLGAGLSVNLEDSATAQLNVMNNLITSDTATATRTPGVTFVLDFIEADQGPITDGLTGFPLTAFDPGAFGFGAGDTDLLAEATLAVVQEQFFGIPTVGEDARSPLPDGQELDVDFVIGNVGEAPSNGATEFYTVFIGETPNTTVPLGLGFLGIVRDENGNGPNFGAGNGDNVATVYTSALGPLGPFNGDIEPTQNFLANVTSHEIGHTLSLNHLAVAGSVTPTGAQPILFTGAIDGTNPQFLTQNEFAFSGTNPEINNQEQFHVQQLISALGTRPVVTPGISGDGIAVSVTNSARLENSTFINNTIDRNDGDGLRVFAGENAVVDGLTIQGNTITTNSGRGIDLIAEGSGAFISADQTIGGRGMNFIGGNQFTQGNTITGNLGDGFRALASNGGTINGNILNNVISTNGGNGVALNIENSGTLDFGNLSENRIIEGNTIQDNTGVGISLISQVDATGTGLIDAVVRSNTITGNQGGGISSDLFGPNAGISNTINLTVGGTAEQSNNLDGNNLFGIRFATAGNGLGNFNLTNSSIQNTTGDGIQLFRSDASLLLANIDNVTSSNNTGNGLTVDVQGNDRLDPNQPMTGTPNTVDWNNSTFNNNGANGASFRVRGDAVLIADGSLNTTNDNGNNGVLIETSEFSQFGDVTLGPPPGQRTIFEGLTANGNGQDGLGVIATDDSRVLLEVTSNQSTTGGASGSRGGLSTVGSSSFSNNGRDGININTLGGQSDILITSGTAPTIIDGNGTNGGGNGVRFVASNDSAATVQITGTQIRNSIAGATEDPANFNNGILDPGEDINGNGILDTPFTAANGNGFAGEDGGNDDIDTEDGDGIRFDVFNQSTATLIVGGVNDEDRNIIQNNADDGIAISATGQDVIAPAVLLTAPNANDRIEVANSSAQDISRPVIAITNNVIGSEDDGVPAGNGGDGISVNLVGGTETIVRFGADSANADTDLGDGTGVSLSNGVTQSGPILQFSASGNIIRGNNNVGANFRLNGAGGERDREDGNNLFDPINITLNNNEISSNGAEGIFFRADSETNQGRSTFLSNLGFPNDDRVAAFSPLLPEFQGQNAGSVNGNTAFASQAPDGEQGFINLRTIQNSFLTITGNTIQNNGQNQVTGEGVVLAIGTGSYAAVDFQGNTLGGNLEEDFRTESFLSNNEVFASIDDNGMTNFDVIFHDDSAQLDLRFLNNTGNQIAPSAEGAVFTDADPQKAIVLGITPTNLSGVTDRDVAFFQLDDGPNVDNPANGFTFAGITQDIDAVFIQGGFSLRNAADPLFPNIGFAPFLP